MQQARYGERRRTMRAIDAKNLVLSMRRAVLSDCTDDALHFYYFPRRRASASARDAAPAAAGPEQRRVARLDRTALRDAGPLRTRRRTRPAADHA